MRKSQFVLAVFLLLVVAVLNTRTQSDSAASQITVVLEGDRDNSDQFLLDEANECFAAYAPSGDVERVIPECVRILTQNMRNQGFLQSVVKEVDRKTTENGLRLVLHVKEGARYELGQVNIEGNKLLTTEHLLGMLSIKPGEVMNGGVLIKWLGEHIKLAYGAAGYIQYEFDVEPEFNEPTSEDKDGVVNLNVQINEGSRFTVRRIEFVGNARTRDHVVWQAMSLREGDIHNQWLVERSISNLDDLGLFERINVNRDVSIHTVEEKGVLDMTINLKEREQ